MAHVNYESVSLPRVIYRDCRDILKIARMTPAWAKRSGRPQHQVFITALKLLFNFRFTPNEIGKNGILASNDPLYTAQTKISKRELIKLQAALNPKEIEPLTHHKALFDMAIDGKEFPPSPTIAIFFNGYRGTVKNGPAPSDFSSWEAALDEHLPEEFVVKPATGALGAGVRFYKRGSDKNLECLSSGSHITIGDLVNLLNSDSYYNCYLFQARLRNHEALKAITHSQALQTIRIVTLLNSAGEVEILIARWRLGAVDALTDNFRGGLGGSIVCQIDPNRGQIHEAMTQDESGKYKLLEFHPVTGKRLTGLALPDWGEVQSLVSAAAKAMAPLRTIGWDVAISETGPILVEANPRWDPPNECHEIQSAIQRLKTSVAG